MARFSKDIRGMLLDEIYWGHASPVAQVAERLSMTTQGVLLHVKKLLDSGEIRATGERRHRQYWLVELESEERVYRLGGGEGAVRGVDEGEVWKGFVAPMLGKLAAEDVDICHYGLTEMFNNAIDHSRGTAAKVRCRRTAVSVEISVEDDGRGIFRTIADALGLSDAREGLLELSKGKFTTDPKRHTGEGIFFSSRLFDVFSIRSGELVFRRTSLGKEWSVEMASAAVGGTLFEMSLRVPTRRVMKDVYAEYSSGPDEYRFARTMVPLKLARFSEDTLISRSAAKRVLARFEKFDTVHLDFSGVPSIGASFADEIFRVFANAHPEVRLIVINANQQVTGMIARAEAARAEGER